MDKSMFYFIFFIAFFLTGQFTGFCGEKIKFTTFPIPRMVENEKEGIFIELTKDMVERASLDIEIEIFPPKRAWELFRRDKIDVIFPAFDVNFPKGSQKVSSIAFSSKPDYVFTRKGTPLLKTIKDLEGKRVGLTIGYPYARELLDNPLIDFDLAPTDEYNAKKLVVGRFDAFIVSLKSGLDTFEKLGLLTKIQYDIKTPISKNQFYYACQNTEKGKKICSQISNALRKMIDDGTLQNIHNKMKN
jgi:polar amino acid transport system substrate-binding protein